MNPTGREIIYGVKDGLPEWVLYFVQAGAGLSLVLTVIVLWKYLPNRNDVFWRNCFYACWVWWMFAPPIWFSFEYFFLFKLSKLDTSFEAFKYGQELASRAWVGIAALLTVIASK